jgi:predicted transposase/invertase (TIGR01784 family)
MPTFNKTVGELVTRFDKWMYILRNLNKLDRIPYELRDSIFERLFEVAEIAKFTPDQARYYEDSVKTYRDMKNSMDAAREEGEMKGKIEGEMIGIIKIAKAMIGEGESIDKIVRLTGLTRGQVEQLTSEQ